MIGTIAVLEQSQVLGGRADPARAFRDVVRHGENLVAMFIQKQVIITKMASAPVPVEILRFHVMPENIGQQQPQFFTDFGDAIRLEIGGRF